MSQGRGKILGAFPARITNLWNDTSKRTTSVLPMKCTFFIVSSLHWPLKRLARADTKLSSALFRLKLPRPCDDVIHESQFRSKQSFRAGGSYIVKAKFGCLW